MFSQELFLNRGFYIRASKQFQIIPGYFCLNFQITGYSRFPAKMANLIIYIVIKIMYKTLVKEQ